MILSEETNNLHVVLSEASSENYQAHGINGVVISETSSDDQ
jgi:hypothetical protein